MNFLSLETILLMTPILFIALPVHEFAHGWVAYRLGDPTAKTAGRLTFNPFKHLDLIGVLMMYTAGFGWAKPVPVNFGNLKNRRSGMILVAMAGPLSNIMLAFVSVFIFGVISKLADTGVIVLNSEGLLKPIYYISLFFFYFGTVNISLAIFNTLPVPPLDGSRLISAFVPEEAYYRFSRYEQYIGLAFLTIVILVPNDFISGFIRAIAGPVFRSMVQVTQTILGIDANNMFWMMIRMFTSEVYGLP